jgi:photosynthetic reaction center cytochrome c subunit
LSAFLVTDHDPRVQGDTALRQDNVHNIKQAKWTYSLMMYMSNSLGVNCNYCHTTSAFGRWERSTPQRATAWYGIRMVRELNSSYLIPIKSLLPENRLSAEGDGPKVGCATCHKGTYKPLYGVTMLNDYPVLAGLYVAPPAAEPAPSPVSAPASPAPNDTKKAPAAASGKSAAAGAPLTPKPQGQAPQKTQVQARQGPQALHQPQVHAMQEPPAAGAPAVQGTQAQDRPPVLVAGSAPEGTRADNLARP